MRNCRLSDITPVILAGGKSSRMGRNKSFVTLEGKPLIEIVLDTVNSIFIQPPVIITNSPELYEYLDVTLAGDIYKAKGPLAGIHAGLIHSSTAYSFVFACDMPFLDVNFIRFMVSRLQEEQVLIPRDGNLVEPLHAVYAHSCLPHIEEKLNSNICKIQAFFSAVRIGYVDMNEYEHALNCFANINSEADLAVAETVLLKPNK